MRLMNDVLRPFFRKLFMVHFDNIFMYSHDEACHVEHLTCVFNITRQQKLHAKLEK